MIAGLLGLLAPAASQADWAPGPQYYYFLEATHDATTGKVTVRAPKKMYAYSTTIEGWLWFSTCQDLGGVLRENTKTGEVVALPCFNEPKSKDPTVTVDSCVPPGDYRYGLKQPIGCNHAYYGLVAVSSVPTGCTPESGAPAATVYSGTLPWDGASQNKHFCEEEVGCSTSRGRINGVVFGAQALALAAGLALLLWRRRSRG